MTMTTDIGRPGEVPVHDPDTHELLGWVHLDLDGEWSLGHTPRHRAPTPYRDRLHEWLAARLAGRPMPDPEGRHRAAG